MVQLCDPFATLLCIGLTHFAVLLASVDKNEECHRKTVQLIAHRSLNM